MDLGLPLAELARRVEILLWPVALDFKKSDVEALPDGDLDAAFINGAIRLSEQEEWAHLLRRKARIVVAVGSCAHLGGIPGLANFRSVESLLRTVYHATPGLDSPSADTPARDLPPLLPAVRPLSQVVKVDYVLPGCPPPTDAIAGAFDALLRGALPPPPAVLAPSKALCDTCPLRDTRPERLELRQGRRLAFESPEMGTCFLAQGFLCLGPGTRSGCGETCIRANYPCRGCFGPVEGVPDQGLALLSALASLLAHLPEEEARSVAEGWPDLPGTLYRYGLPASLLNRLGEERER